MANCLVISFIKTKTKGNFKVAIKTEFFKKNKLLKKYLGTLSLIKLFNRHVELKEKGKKIVKSMDGKFSLELTTCF
jgi:hypothetical protein